MGDLYDRYRNVCYSVIHRIVGDHHVAEDVVQETFLRVWTRAHLYDADRGRLSAWVVTIARNRAFDYLRASNKQMVGYGCDRLDQIPSTFANSRCGTLDDCSASLKAALGKLTNDQKLVLDLAYFYGLSQAEMAVALKTPLGTVKTWVRSALRTLREEMQVQEPDRASSPKFQCCAVSR